MPSWFTSYGDDVGMTSSCSHNVCIALMMSSRLGHDVIAICVNHDRQTLSMTDRPFVHDISIMADNRQTYVQPRSILMTGRPMCMTYRPWRMTGRPICDLEVLRISS